MEEELSLGSVMNLCELEEMEIAISTDIDATINWNTLETGPSILVNQEGKYWANLYYGDCAWTTDTLQVSLVNCEACQYYIPNIFSPQGDGSNDFFKVYFDDETCDLVSFKMSIFDRWGSLLFETQENSWDGTYKNKPLNNGVYIYMIEMVTNTNGSLNPIVLKGDISILK